MSLMLKQPPHIVLREEVLDSPAPWFALACDVKADYLKLIPKGMIIKYAKGHEDNGSSLEAIISLVQL